MSDDIIKRDPTGHIRVWQVIPRPDRLDIGVKPATAIGTFARKHHAEYFGRHLYGQYYEVRSTTVCYETYREIFNCE